MEITAEYPVSEIAPRPPLTVRPRVSFGAKTDLGLRRENNEDKHEFFVPTSDDDLAWRGMVFVVCDGMGGHEAGQIASEMTCKEFIRLYRESTFEDPVEAAKNAVATTNRFVYSAATTIPNRKGMGTTLSALLLVQDQAHIVQVGDSRVYRLRDGELQQLTKDHTWVEETVELGVMSREQAEAHQYRHVLTRAVGTEPDVKTDAFTESLAVGDTFMLCSDGVTNHVTDEEIKAILSSNDPSQAAWTLVGRALMGGGSDNATVIVVHVDALESVTQ